MQLEAHRRCLYTYTMSVITILGTITAALKPALNLTACHFTGFTDVQALNVAVVIDRGIVFLLDNFANMTSLNTVIVLDVLVGAIILRLCIGVLFFFFFWVPSQLR